MAPSALSAAMSYTVIFYAVRADLGEITISTHRVEKAALPAYTATPGVALAAARTVKGQPQANGFRVIDPRGSVVLDYVDQPARK